MYDDKDYEELTIMLQDAIERHDKKQYDRILAEMNWRTSHYE